jgi:hypothetical protein
MILVIQVIGSSPARPLNGRHGKVESFLSWPRIRLRMFRVYDIYHSIVFFEGTYGDP